MCVIIFYRDSSKQFDLMMVLICFSSINTDKSIFYLPIDAIVSYNTEPKHIVTKTILVAITAFLRAFSGINK